PWNTETQNESNKSTSIAELLAAKFNKHKKRSSVIKASSMIKPSSTTKPLSMTKSLSMTKPSSATKPSTTTKPSIMTKLSTTTKSSSVIKFLSVIKPSTMTTKPYTRTRSKRKLTDLAKEILTDSNEAEILVDTEAK
ncbi:8487_t:CDS:1, partial [Scutellospora calospora]